MSKHPTSFLVYVQGNWKFMIERGRGTLQILILYYILNSTVFFHTSNRGFSCKQKKVSLKASTELQLKVLISVMLLDAEVD